MSKTVAVSFEESRVKIVHASLKGQNLTIDSSEIVDLQEFESYLKKEKASEFIVTSHFDESHNGTLTTPVVKPSVQHKIVEAEIRKKHDLKEFSFVFNTIGERLEGNRKTLEVFYYAINSDEVRKIVDIFHNNGKSVKALYPAVFSSLPLLASCEGPDNDAVMGVTGTGERRYSFIEREGSILFTRDYELRETVLTDLDIQNINMTISYCFQNLRVSPSSVMLIGNLSESSDVSAVSSVPLSCLSQPDYIKCGGATFNEFSIPIGSFYSSRSSNILNQDFKNIYTLKKSIAYASQAFVLLSIICIALIFSEVQNISSQEEAIEAARQEGQDIESIYDEYLRREDKISAYMPVVEFINRPSPRISRLLADISSIVEREMEIISIEAKSEDDRSFMIALNGTSSAGSFISMRSSFGKIIDALEKVKGIEISDKVIDMETKNFRIEMNYGRKNDIL